MKVIIILLFISIGVLILNILLNSPIDKNKSNLLNDSDDEDDKIKNFINNDKNTNPWKYYSYINKGVIYDNNCKKVGYVIGNDIFDYYYGHQGYIDKNNRFILDCGRYSKMNYDKKTHKFYTKNY